MKNITKSILWLALIPASALLTTVLVSIPTFSSYLNSHFNWLGVVLMFDIACALVSMFFAKISVDHQEKYSLIKAISVIVGNIFVIFVCVILFIILVPTIPFA